MNEEALQIHGSIFILFKKFVENNYSNDTWLKLSKAAGTSELAYEMHKNYPASEMFSMIKTGAYYMGFSENELKERFGENLVPDLLNMFKSHINPAWKTFEMLQNTEQVMHRAVRNEVSKARPPILNVTKVNDKLLIIDYYSKRKMASLAVGIIKGIARFYNESEKVRAIPQTDPNDERVQIRVEFS